MEGALATVIGGLLPQPIIGVPVSVGYGVSKDGMVALNSMLASCSPGIMVMNIDNGYGAAMAAIRIIKGWMMVIFYGRVREDFLSTYLTFQIISPHHAFL